MRTCGSRSWALTAYYRRAIEENAELILALGRHDQNRIAEEAADLVYHLLVALLGSEVTLEELLTALEKRKV